MPELPDLIYIQKKLSDKIIGKEITDIKVRNPIIIRNLLNGDINDILSGLTFKTLALKGHFLLMELDKIHIVVNFMLSGKFQYQQKNEKPGKYLCMSFKMDDGNTLNYLDNKQMGKIYFSQKENFEKIPGLMDQGIDILSADFDIDNFKRLIKKKKNQIRAFLMDHTLLSSIGNAYADEILFDARIHPKTFCNRLSEEKITELYESIKKVMLWGIEMVDKADQPIEVKVREHLKVRNRKNEQCPVCGSTIRRESVLGYDTFYCPTCQPPSRKHFISWES